MSVIALKSAHALADKVYMPASEENILFESEHLYAYQVSPKRIQIRLLQVTHSIVIGTVSSLDDARRFITRCERYPENLRYLHLTQHKTTNA
jgi:hypothetical protein